jgi:hypothetical protein
MTATLSSDSPRGAAGTRSRRPTGPPLGVLAAISLGLALAALAAAVVAGRGYASPFAPTGQLLDYHRHGVALRLSATLQFGSAVPLGIFAATAYTRLLRLGARVPGPSIGFFGGVAASLMLMISASAGWVLSHPEVGGDPAVTRALSLFAFLTGGVGFVVGLGLLLAGLAVPTLILRLAPRWLAWTGLAVAVVCEVGFLAMAIPGLQVLLPVGRYAGLAWLVGIGFLLPTRRPTAREGRR